MALELASMRDRQTVQIDATQVITEFSDTKTHSVQGTSLAQMSFQRGRLHSQLFEEALPRKVGRSSAGWLRPLLGVIMALCATLSYTDFPLGWDAGAQASLTLMPGGWPVTAPKESVKCLLGEGSFDSDLSVNVPVILGEVDSNLCDNDMLLGQDRDMNAQEVSVQVGAPSPLGRAYKKLTPRFTKLHTLSEEPPDELRTRDRQGKIPERQNFQGLFRETQRAFREADSELAEALAHSPRTKCRQGILTNKNREEGLFRESKLAFMEADAELAAEERLISKRAVFRDTLRAFAEAAAEFDDEEE